MQNNMEKNEDLEDEKELLNNLEDDSEPQVNRGSELLLRTKRKRREPPKTFSLKFGKMVTLFKREFHLNLDINFDVKKS